MAPGLGRLTRLRPHQRGGRARLRSGPETWFLRRLSLKKARDEWLMIG
jgi:hypothetical protein